jgi:hypothetical protein
MFFASLELFSFVFVEGISRKDSSFSQALCINRIFLVLRLPIAIVFLDRVFPGIIFSTIGWRHYNL